MPSLIRIGGGHWNSWLRSIYTLTHLWLLKWQKKIFFNHLVLFYYKLLGIFPQSWEKNFKKSFFNVFFIYDTHGKKPGDPVIRSPTEIQFLRWRRAKLRRIPQNGPPSATFSMYIDTYFECYCYLVQNDP